MRAIMVANIQYGAGGLFPKNEEFRAVFQSMGLEPTDLPLRSNGETDDDFEQRLKQYFQQRAEKILARIPGHNPEQVEKIKFEKESIIYSSYLAGSDTDFMVTRRSGGSIRFRLLNSRIGKLHEGSADLVKLIGAYNTGKIVGAQDQADKRMSLKLDDWIEIYEHGLEEPTITGEIVYSRAKYIWSQESREVLIALGSVILFLFFLLINPSLKLSHPSIFAFFERLETAMLTTFIVSALALAHAYFRLVPLIQWSLTYDDK
jgi:hypothetical protein